MWPWLRTHRMCQLPHAYYFTAANSPAGDTRRRFAARCGAKKVYAVEASGFAPMARELVQVLATTGPGAEMRCSALTMACAHQQPRANVAPT
jgi:hypothetical protein